MKARVKATGEIVEVKSKVITSPCTGNTILKYVDQKKGISYFEEDLFFPKDLANDPDYWTRFEHQAAISAMQGILSNNVIMNNIRETKEETMVKIVTNFATNYARALMEKYKEKEEK